MTFELDHHGRRPSRQVAKGVLPYVPPPAAVISANPHGVRAFEYRASVANVVRRENRGEQPVTCVGCGCETDVAAAAHAVRCPA